ncbi:PAS domain-containing protein [Vannielia litorea]|uniref:PAS domain-containing protein n=1 Tax=Vannielia litorea TaxID=1217970 RepID=UPI001C9686AB|nr:PAS domain-containing protein [Vannielia litorea]MBY6048594.1 PAS domain-containing protein [Vannielia litorea]MBY6076008.1 PAS domain-containing protein [Vannielia litorea]
MSEPEGQRQRPSKGEAPFEFDEIFFSRTDDRGVIQSGNSIFQRVSEYPWDKLIGAPHKVIRHPDMPKGFFHLFWERLKAERMVSGYVKNRSADGLHYWVYALASPLPGGGFLSVRIKPSGETFDHVAKAYAEALKLEAEQQITPAESAELIVARLKTLGYSDYEHFMASSLAEELAARDVKLGRKASERGLRFSQVAKSVNEAIAHTNALCETFNAIEAVPHNMRILASRLEASGGPIAAISSNYGSMSKEISDWVDKFILGEESAFATLRDAVSRSRMLSATARVMEEARVQFDGETGEMPTGLDRSAEKALLHEISQIYRKLADDYLHTVEREAIVFGRAVGDMKRLIAGLSTTRMMCKIESARLPDHNESLLAIIDQLDKFQSELEDRLDKIGSITSTVLTAARSLEIGGTEAVQLPSGARTEAA